VSRRGLKTLKSGVQSIIGGLGDLLLPPSCAVCNALLDDPKQVVCPVCFEGFERLAQPICASCGQPCPESEFCPECKSSDPVCSIRSAFAFGGSLAEAVVKLKFESRCQLAPFFARLIFESSLPGYDLTKIDLVIPVPLHSAKLKERGFNQSALIAGQIAGLLRVPFDYLHLARSRPTESQSKMKTRFEREQNVKGAFSTTKKHPLAAKRICLIDDVVTTGSTLRACAETLTKAGAESVIATTLARTIHW